MVHDIYIIDNTQSVLNVLKHIFKNEVDYHFINTNIDDMKYDICGDIATVVEGDHCPNCDGICE